MLVFFGPLSDNLHAVQMVEPRRLAYSTGSTSTQPAGHAGWGDADFSLVGHNDGELKAARICPPGLDLHTPLGWVYPGCNGGIQERFYNIGRISRTFLNVVILVTGWNPGKKGEPKDLFFSKTNLVTSRSQGCSEQGPKGTNLAFSTQPIELIVDVQFSMNTSAMFMPREVLGKG